MEYNESELQSKSIEFFRFPLAFLVVLLHSFSWTTKEIQKLGDISPIYDFLSFLLVDNVCRLAVPIFFIMSGFLLFYNVTEYNFFTYKKKLRSRIKTLFIPYLFWNALVILLHLVISAIYPSSLSGATKPIAEYTLLDYVSCFWSMDLVNGFEHTPINTPLWFIRDLILFVVFSPVVYIIIKKMKIWVVLFLAIVYLFALSPLHGYETSMLVFCTLGAYMGIYKKSILKLGCKYSCFAFFILVIVNYVIHNAYVSRAQIFIGISALWYLVPILVKRGREIPPLLTTGAFVIYAVHMEILKILSRLFFKWCGLTNDLALLFVLAQVVVAIAFAILLKKICLLIIPRFSRAVMGMK